MFVPGSEHAHVLTARSKEGKGRARDLGAVNIALETGELVLHPVVDTTIHSTLADVKVKKGGLVAVSIEDAGMRLDNCGDLGTVVLQVGKHKFELKSGEEVVISDHELTEDEQKKADGIGRRKFQKIALDGGIHATMCEVSISGVLTNTAHLEGLRNPASMVERNLKAKMMKTAAAVHTVTQSHGLYQSKARVFVPAKKARPSYAAVSFNDLGK